MSQVGPLLNTSKIDVTHFLCLEYCRHQKLRPQQCENDDHTKIINLFEPLYGGET